MLYMEWGKNLLMIARIEEAGKNLVGQNLFGYEMSAMEPVIKARAKLKGPQSAFAGIQWSFGTGESLPYKDNSVNLALATWSVKYVRDPLRTIEEMYRVLKFDRWLSFVFAHKDPEFWHLIIETAENCGFEYIGAVDAISEKTAEKKFRESDTVIMPHEDLLKK